MEELLAWVFKTCYSRVNGFVVFFTFSLVISVTLVILYLFNFYTGGLYVNPLLPHSTLELRIRAGSVLQSVLLAWGEPLVAH